MSQFKLFNNYNKKKIALIALIILALLFILGKNYISELVKVPSIRIHLINIAKVAIPLKNLILMRSVDDKIALLKTSGSCVFCDLTQGNFSGKDLKGVDLRYAILTGANLNNVNLSKANLNNVNLSNLNLSNANLSHVNLSNFNLSNTNLSHANLSNTNLSNANLSNTNLSHANLNGVTLHKINLSGVNLDGVDLSGIYLYGADLSNTVLTGTILTYANLAESNLDGVDLSNNDLTGVNLSGVDLSNTVLTGTILTYANLAESNLDGVDLSNKDLTGVNLSGVDLSNTVLTGTILTYANLAGSNLDGVDLSNKDLTGVNLSGVDLSNTVLTGTILVEAKKIKISIKNPSNSNWPALNEIQNLNVTRYDLSGDVQYLATKEGFLFESKNNESRLALDLNKDALFPFTDYEYNGGLLGVASNDEFVYISYSSKGPNFSSDTGVYGDSLTVKEFSSLIVDEYSKDFKKSRNIIKIDGYLPTHYGGALVFDKKGRLYLSTGDGGPHPDQNNHAQDLQDLRGKILRLDVSKLKQEPDIIAYGLRNPFGVSIDSKDRMFIVTCGLGGPVAVYLLNDLYSSMPPNLGWPLFEGSEKTSYDIYKKKRPKILSDILAPIYENNIKPGCLTAGVYLDDIELFLFGDFYGAIRLLKQQKNGGWSAYYSDKLENSSIWGFGLDKKTKKIYIAPNNLELEILVNQVKLSQ